MPRASRTRNTSSQMSDVDNTRDTEGDSQMHSSLELLPDDCADDDDDDDMFPDADNAPSTPPSTTQPASELSPPDSQGAPAGPPRSNVLSMIGSKLSTSSGGSVLNANGKRAHASDEKAGAGAGAGAGPASGARQSTQGADGYAWSRPEDEPGYVWRNKKAQEEYARAMELVVDKGSMIGNRFGDVLLEGQVVRMAG